MGTTSSASVRAVDTDSEGRPSYRVRFIGRSDLDSNDFTSERPYMRGDPLGDFHDGEWRVQRIEEAPPGNRDTLVLEQVEPHSSPA
jgi:hypothetical protein